MLYGREPRQLGLTVSEVSPVPDVQAWLDERQTMMELLQQHLNRAQQCMKTQADKKRSERSFKVGDKAYLKLQPYVQMSVSKWANHKLSFKYYGPYSIIARIGSVAYKLALPEESKIHLVFQVSQLKPAHQREDQVHTDLPANASLFQVPLVVLDYRWHKTANGMVHQGLISWSHSVPKAAKWEDLEDFHRRFPQAPAWLPLQVLQTRWRQTPTKPVKQGLIFWSYTGTKDKATWDDLELLHRCYPSAPAWGQAGSQGGRIVSTTTDPAVQPDRPKLHGSPTHESMAQNGKPKARRAPRVHLLEEKVEDGRGIQLDRVNSIKLPDRKSVV